MRKHKREKWTPRPHQKKASKWLVSRPEAALFLEPGLGKSSAALNAFKALMKAGVTQKALIIAPLRVCYMVWTQDPEGELGKWKNFEDITVSLVHGKDKEEALKEDVNLYVTNPGTIPWLLSKEDGKKKTRLSYLISSGVELLIIDELSMFKHTRTKRFKDFYPLAARFKRRWGLTGSPAPNGLLDLFGQVKMIDRGKSLGPYITGYRHTYFVPGGFQGKVWTIQEDGAERIYKQIDHLALSMRALDHLKMPGITTRDIFVLLPKKVIKAYETLEEELITSFEKETVTAANGAVACGKLRQVASGGVYADQEDGLLKLNEKRKVHHLHDEKTDALMELLDELQGSPLLIGYQFRHDLDRINKAFKKKYKRNIPNIGGGTTPKETAEVVRSWNAGELIALAGHPASMGHGLNLQQECNHICWYSAPWDYDHYDQFNRRVWRQGSKAKRVIVHRIVARGTIDEYVLHKLKGKSRTQDDLLKALKTQRQARLVM